MQKSSVSLCVSVVALAFSWSTPSQAQSPSKSRVTIIHLKPDMVNEFLDLEKNEVVPALKKGGQKSRTVYSTTLFGDGFEYVVVTPLGKFAELDGDNPQLKALGAAANQKLGEKLRGCIDSANSFLTTNLADLSNPVQGGAPAARQTITRFRVAPGKTQDFENLVKADILPAYKKAKMGLSVNRRGLGTNGNDFVFISTFNKFAEMDAGSAAERALGQDGLAKVRAKLPGIANVLETTVQTRVADLSF
jgi:hypothetical protein